MGRIFSVFEPSTGSPILARANWLALLAIMFLPSAFWLSNRKAQVIVSRALKSLAGEIKINSKLTTRGSISLTIVSVFLLIVTNNFLGLLPYVFTATRHLAVTLVLALSTWVGYTLYRIRLNPSNFFSHLVPEGSPAALVPFIVVIELIRRAIRPLTLAVRLAANIVAGHLLLVLASSPIRSLRVGILMLVLRAVVTLIVLELAVSFIQGYVFASLTSLYVGEVNARNL